MASCALLLLLLLPPALSSTYAPLGSSCFNNALLPNASLFDYNLSGTSRFIVFHNSTFNPHQDYYLAFLSFSPSSFVLSILVNGSPTSALEASTLKVVWTANHDSPVNDGASLQLAPDGNLLLWDVDGSVAWASRSSGLGVSALLLKEGSLQLLDDANVTVWQSSDHPSDSLLPGQRLEYNQAIVNWDPAARATRGSYILLMNAGGMALSVSVQDPQVYWTLGYFGNDTFSISHTCNLMMAAEFSTNSALELLVYQDDATAGPSTNYSAFCNRLNTAKNESYLLSQHDSTNLTHPFLRIENDGNLRGYAFANSTGWQIFWELINSSRNSCLLPDHCGAYGVCVVPGQCVGCPTGDDGVALKSSSSSCSFSYEPTTCSNSTGNSWEMLSLTGVDYFATQYTASINVSSKDECKQLCMENCTCAAAFYHIDSASCFMMGQLEGSLHNVSDNNRIAFLKFDVRDLVSPGNNSSSTTLKSITIGVVTGVGGILMFLVAFFIFLVLRRKAGNPDMDKDGVLDFAGMMPTRFSFKDLERATHGFTEKLGNGGFGAVYKGVLPDGRAVAVKKLEGALQGHKEFSAEVAALGSIHHWHLVQLYGFCVEGSHRLLVYDYLSNGSLEKWLFSEDSSTLLSWDLRSSIALGMARGLSYLHAECKERIIHLDIKPQNVLLDHNFVAKVSDFGLSRFLSRDEGFVVTTMRGTPGYVAPEWLLDSAITEKSDVYSFGMVLLELVSGRKNYCPKNRSSVPEECYVPARALRMIQEHREVELVDPRLGEAFDEEEARRMVKIALLCVQEHSTKRPSMYRVVQMLGCESEVPEPPIVQNLHMFLEAHFRLMMGSPSTLTDSSLENPSEADQSDQEAQGTSYTFVYSHLSGR